MKRTYSDWDEAKRAMDAAEVLDFYWMMYSTTDDVTGYGDIRDVYTLTLYENDPKLMDVREQAEELESPQEGVLTQP